jgi:hypothetical protein
MPAGRLSISTRRIITSGISRRVQGSGLRSRGCWGDSANWTLRRVCTRRWGQDRWTGDRGHDAPQRVAASSPLFRGVRHVRFGSFVGHLDFLTARSRSARIACARASQEELPVGSRRSQWLWVRNVKERREIDIVHPSRMRGLISTRKLNEFRGANSACSSPSRFLRRPPLEGESRRGAPTHILQPGKGLATADMPLVRQREVALIKTTDDPVRPAAATQSGTEGRKGRKEQGRGLLADRRSGPDGSRTQHTGYSERIPSSRPLRPSVQHALSKNLRTLRKL